MIAVFDLDHTLIEGDSDLLWGEFLTKHQLINRPDFVPTNERFFEQYHNGTLDIHEYVAFQLAILRDNPVPTLLQWRKQYVREMLKPIVRPHMLEIIEKHRKQGHQLMLLTATNCFIAEPMAQMFGMDHMIAIQPETKEGAYTGNYVGTITFREGKIVAFRNWCTSNNCESQPFYFYSDSHNDLPLLQESTYPHAVCPDDKLRAVALEKKWPIIDCNIV